jgi:perosamine synthetase
MSSIPVYKPFLDLTELKNVIECVESSWISSKGPFIKKFEKAFATRIDISNATTVSNGTVALHVALLALGVGPGDEVIVPTLTYIASVNAIKYVGATPIFIDCNLSDWQIDTSKIEAKITEKTRAIMAVHVYGNPTDMIAIMTIARKFDLKIIEDCAEAIGTYINGRHVGTFGDVSTFSFFGNKTITTGEGGMVVSNSREVIEMVERLKGQGLAAGREYWHDLIGYNYRMTNICASIGLAQLEKLETILEKKRSIANFYFENLKNLPVQFQEVLEGGLTSHWMCSILCENEEKRDGLRKHLSKVSIETRPLFPPIHLMEMYTTKENFPLAESISVRGLNLPSFPSLTSDELNLIVLNIKEFLEK